MTRYLLDTNHAGLLLRDDKSPLWDRLQQFTRRECLWCRPVVAELWFMVYNSASPAANVPRLEALLAQFEVLEFDAGAAIEFGLLRAELRRQGRPIPLFDMLIAAIARHNGVTLVTSDGHFAAVNALVTESWLP